MLHITVLTKLTTLIGIGIKTIIARLHTAISLRRLQRCIPLEVVPSVTDTATVKAFTRPTILDSSTGLHSVVNGAEHTSLISRLTSDTDDTSVLVKVVLFDLVDQQHSPTTVFGEKVSLIVDLDRVLVKAEVHVLGELFTDRLELGRVELDVESHQVVEVEAEHLPPDVDVRLRLAWHPEERNLARAGALVAVQPGGEGVVGELGVGGSA